MVVLEIGLSQAQHLFMTILTQTLIACTRMLAMVSGSKVIVSVQEANHVSIG